MKIDRRRPWHWCLLALFGVNVVLALLLRRLLRRKPDQRRRIILYGHKLNGNLLAILRQAQAHHHDAFDMVFLTMDGQYHDQLRRQGEPSCRATTPRCIPWLVNADAVISDHGLHVLELMLGRTDMQFFDVWHGIPFKGFDEADFLTQHRFTETWVASPTLRDLYIHRFGFAAERVVSTGYARTDRLIRPTGTRSIILQGLGLSDLEDQRLILFAPTWQQDDRSRSPFPFSADPNAFLAMLAKVAARHGARVLFRAHLNESRGIALASHGIIPVPFAERPDTESILLVSDVLICDWSSIAFDYLLLERPTFFLDVAPPFCKGFSLGAEFRYGPVARDTDHLMRLLDATLGDDASGGVDTKTRQRMVDTRRQVYQGYDDGWAAERCIERLQHHLFSCESSR